MLLPLLGTCALVGPFQGPEWEPVRDLLSQDRSCRDPRCCSNLLVLCLFLIWQVRHSWYQITRTRPRMRSFIKAPLQEWAVPPRTCEALFRLVPAFVCSPGKFRGPDAHVQKWAREQRWGYWRDLQDSWDPSLLSLDPYQDSPWGVHVPSEPIFCTTSFSSNSLVPLESSWEAWQVPLCVRDDWTHPALGMCQRMEQLLVHSQERSVPQEPVISMRFHHTSTTSAISLPKFPSAQSPQFPPDSSHQQLIVPSWDFPREAWMPGSESQTVGREDITEIQTPGRENQVENRREDNWKIQASGQQLPTDFGMEDDAEAKVLGRGSQRLVINELDEEILTPASRENQDQTGLENRSKSQEVGKRNQRESRSKNPETQARMEDTQEQLRCKIYSETQTPEWGNQEKSGGEDVVETQTFERENKNEATEEDKGEIQVQGLGVQVQTGGENDAETQILECGKQDQIRGNTGAEIQTEGGRNKDHVGGKDAGQTQTARRENLGEVEKENGTEIPALNQRHEGVTEIQTPQWEKQGQGGSEEAGRSQASRGENQKLLRHATQVEWGNQGLGRGGDARETQVSKAKKLREIREEDWVVIQVPLWGNQSPAASEIDREFETSCWGNENEAGGKHRAETQAPETEMRDQRKDKNEDTTSTLVLKVKNQGHLRGETEVETHPVEKENKEQFGDGHRTDNQGPGNTGKVRYAHGKETQELGGGNEGQLGSKSDGKVHVPELRNQEHSSKPGADIQTAGSENWGEFTSKIDGETHSLQWKKEGQVGGEKGAEIQIRGKRYLSEAGSEDGTESWAPGEENQSQLKNDSDRKTPLAECKYQGHRGGKNGTAIQAPEKRSQREPRGEDCAKTQTPEQGNQVQLDGETSGSHSPGRRGWEQGEKGKNSAENQASKKRNQTAVGSENRRKIQRLRGKNQNLLSKVNGKTCSSEWKNQEQNGGGNGAKIQTQQERTLNGTISDGGTETQARGGDDQAQFRSKTDGELKTQGQETQKEDAGDIWNVESQRKRRAEDAGGPQAPRQGNKDQVEGKDAAKASLQVDCSRGEGPTGQEHSLVQPPALTSSGYGPMEQEQAVAANALAFAPHLERKPPSHHGEVFLLAGGEGELLASQSMAHAKEHRVRASSASQQAQSEPQRRWQRGKGTDAGRASSLPWQPQDPQSLATSLGVPPSCLSLLCDQAPEAATVLTGLPKWPVLKKSKWLLLESLMRRRIAHLKWGLPRRILESYLLFSLLDPCSLPPVRVRVPGSCTGQKLQGQPKRHCETQDSTPGLRSQERSWGDCSPERKSSKLPPWARALEKHPSRVSVPLGISISPEKARRVWPPGGAREPREIQAAASRAQLPAPRNSRPAAETKSWCGRERVREPSCENNRGKKAVRAGDFQVGEGAPSRGRTSSSKAALNYWSKASTSWEASKPPRLKCQHPTYRRRGSPEVTEGRKTGQQPSFSSTATSSFTESLNSAAARLSTTLLNKMSWSQQLAKPQRSAPNLSQRYLDPTPCPKVGNPYARAANTGVHTVKGDHQPPAHCCAGTALPRRESPQSQGAPGNLHGIPRNLKFGFMRHLRYFLSRYGFKK
ncbi:uncharacterized protein C22orf46 homolog [Tupaia chinensis]|uniref:uncharacterized protein C22orf46 homolog n=1 Tax=Tupaia chinensis TaxID=246437 RepID=UPI0003C8D598|nr:uncharacterized protein C22orf46 homolog [Tupaia chinensis]